uniref:Uncharacterized protein n=1 Tax=Macaca fascicularis TaxID=9541 RepID=A0A7N9CWA5_MACFA
MCYRDDVGLIKPKRYIPCVTACRMQRNSSSGIHVQNMQICYICMPWWFAAPINPSFVINSNVSSI